MSLSEISITRNAKPIRFRPCRREGLYIQFQLKNVNESFSHIGLHAGVTKQTVHHVVFGRRRSARVEAEIARILGKAEWNEVVLEARSAVSGKPVDELKKEIARKFEEREKTFKADFANKQSRVDAALESRATDAYRKRRAG